MGSYSEEDEDVVEVDVQVGKTETGEHVARCDACSQNKSNHKGNLERHAVTITHIEAMSLYRDKLQQEASMTQFTLPLNDKIPFLELRICTLV
ncbi:hypothetical protein OUZ56_017437 [Daphnia magna]|uniref:Uncharacterized protein n=1 Tax=Daphnia magna TaxID=35525 RepID=A0ABR0AST0_9CRUS|nr:hypothetical protein OUZ56_017437 [Daphnia magna]